MAQEDPKESKVSLLNVRLSFPVLWTPKAFEAGGKEEFSASFLMAKDHPGVKLVQAAISYVATKKWGEKAPEILKVLFRDRRLCLQDGDNKDYEGYAGNYFVRANNSVRPLTINRDKSAVTEKDGIIYSGCYVNASISLWAQDNKFGKRVNANLRGVQYYGDGEAFSGGGTASADEFEGDNGSLADSNVSDLF